MIETENAIDYFLSFVIVELGAIALQELNISVEKANFNG